jgi:glycosyltransferase involved in cell wall biosynthesis
VTVPLWLRKLLRPLIPDAVMARYRLHQHSRQVRTNVDVVVDDPRAQRRWLLATPDTYRVRATAELVPAADHLVVAPGEPLPDASPLLVFVDGDLQGDAALAARLAADPEIDAGVVADVSPPALVRRRRNEPELGPVAVAVTRPVLAEIGGLPPGMHPLPGLLARARDAGLRLGLAPVTGRQAPRFRSDPISRQGVVVVAAVPMHDVGGGGRAAQLALEFLRKGFHVTYVAQYGTAESLDLGLRFVHPDLEQVRFDQFDAVAVAARSAHPELALFEVPAPALLPSLHTLAAGGYRTVYDRIDEWSDPALGGDWYSAEAERRFAAEADHVAASAPDLTAYLEAAGRHDAVLIPNAVNAAIFGRDACELPADFPGAPGPVIGYHGSLYGDWFDWDALMAVAEAIEGASVVVIGDDKAPRPVLPDNVYLLGLKPQGDLPDYVQRFDAGLVPFRITPTTHAVSPLKAYEYLASGVPVAAPPLRSLEGLDGVHTSTDLVSAVAGALAAPKPDRAAVLAEHSWARRVDTLLAAAGVAPPELPGEEPVTVLRPARHHRRAERRS